MLTPKELALETSNIGQAKVSKKNLQVLFSAFLAGMSIAFGYWGYVLIVGNAESSLLFFAKFLGALAFPVGIIIILLSGTDLFTGNCLITLGWMNKQYSIKLVLKNLFLVFVGNFLGGLFFVMLLYFSNMVDANVREMIIHAAEKKVSFDFIEALFRGILCNIIVSLAVYISYAAKTVTGKILAVFLPVMLFVISGYEHSVANMFLLPMAKVLGSTITVYDILVVNLLPVTIGNIIGGALIVPLILYNIYIKKPRTDLNHAK